MSRPDKIDDLLELLKICVEDARYRLTFHAIERMQQRGVRLHEVLEVLTSGWHEKRKDSLDSAYQSWNYAVRSPDDAEKTLRVVVSLHEKDDFDKTAPAKKTTVVVITVIDLDLNT